MVEAAHATAVPAWSAVKPVPKAEGGAAGSSAVAAAAVEAALRAAAPRGQPAAASLEHIGGEAADSFVVRGALTQEECAALVAASEALGYSFWHAEGPGEGANAKKNFRSAHTVEVTCPYLAELVHARCSHLWPARVDIEEDQARAERDILGAWYPVGVNATLLFARYRAGGHFSPHTDGYNVTDFNHRSLYSLLLYLNDCEGGGATKIGGRREEGNEDCESDKLRPDESGRFRYPESAWLCQAECRAGEAVAFFQDRVHEGQPVAEKAVKYIIRTDIMYERRPALCDSPAEREAFELFREAELAEHEGDCERAARLFRRAFKMAPEMAEIYGCR